MQTDEKLEKWVKSCQQVEYCKKQLNRAESELENAQNELGEHLIPADAKVGESFQIWVNGRCIGIPGDCMVSATVLADGRFHVKFRETGRDAKKENASLMRPQSPGEEG